MVLSHIHGFIASTGFAALAMFSFTGLAFAEGIWRLERIDEFQAPVFNSPTAPDNMRDPYCPKHTVDIGPGRDTRNFSIKEVIPGDCHNRAGYRGIQMFSHQWTAPPSLLPAGEIIPFKLWSKVVAIENMGNGTGSSGIYAGFLDYDQPNGPYGPGSNEPAYKIAAIAAEGPPNAGASFSNEQAEKPFVMPAHPWMGSDRNQGRLRFRVWTSHVAPWRAVDYVYRWDASDNSGVGSSNAASLAGTWNINANGYVGKLELSYAADHLSGRVWFDFHQVWETLRDIAFDGRTLRFLRPGPNQYYSGTLSGNEVRGTFDGSGTWVMSRTKVAVPTTDDQAWMGRVWRVRETAPDGRYCDGVWTREGSSNRFTGEWTCSWGDKASDKLVVRPLNGNRVTVFRESIGENYQGILTKDGKGIDGSAWGQGGRWTVMIKK